jgi:hypothetical protein
MSQPWMIIERFENWKIDEANHFSFFGLSNRYRRVAREILAKDLIFSYVSSGRSAFADMRIVQETGLKTLKVQSYDSPFAFYFSTAPLLVLPREKWLSIKEVAADLDLTRGRADFRPLLQTSIRKLTDHDANLLKRKLEEAANQD